MRVLLALLGAAVLSGAAMAQSAPHAHAAPGTQAPASVRPDQTAFRAIYREIVEIDSSASTGSCTRVADAVAAHLRQAGYPEADIHMLAPPEHPNDGNIVAILHGANPHAGAVLLLAHIDVVDAHRADWEHDPFILREENGFFYGRGSSDDKAMASVWVDLMVNLKRQHYRPNRDIKLALTCGEEGVSTNGARLILASHRDWLDAAFALNEGAGGRLDDSGRPIALEIQSGEKTFQTFTFETSNPGGHSSRPRPDNAIYQLAQGLDRLAAYSFPVQLNDVTRGYLRQMAPVLGGQVGADMVELANHPDNEAAARRLSADPSMNATLRTTCVATMLAAGHAPNALPQHASATVNCRMLPGDTMEGTRAALIAMLHDPGIAVNPAPDSRPAGPPPPPLTRQIMGPVEHVAAHMWPHVPVVPTMTAGATDGRYLNEAGIPTYGLSGMFAIPGETNAHGLNEKIRVRSLYQGRDFLNAVVREYAMQH